MVWIKYTFDRDCNKLSSKMKNKWKIHDIIDLCGKVLCVWQQVLILTECFFVLFPSNNTEIHRGNTMAYKSKAQSLPMPCIAFFHCFETAKLFKPIGVPSSCHPIQLFQPWSPSRKPLKFSTKRRSQCSPHIASF